MTFSAQALIDLKYDGAIPAHLMRTETALDLEIGHHRAMIRFSEGRVRDFTESLSRLLARTQDAGTMAWVARTYQIIAEHKADIATHQAALAALVPPFSIAAE
jgi:hypothetical protein